MIFLTGSTGFTRSSRTGASLLRHRDLADLVDPVQKSLGVASSFLALPPMVETTGFFRSRRATEKDEARLEILDSRLRGNDGTPACAGMT
jgi:hypothetical protein